MKNNYKSNSYDLIFWNLRPIIAYKYNLHRLNAIWPKN